MFLFGAETHEELERTLQQQRSTLEGASWSKVRYEAHQSRLAYVPGASLRFALVVERPTPEPGMPPDVGPEALVGQLDLALQQLRSHPEERIWSLPQGLYFAQGESHEAVAALFPGQGAQYVGMLRDLACQFPVMRRALEEADEEFAAQVEGEWRLSDYIYPHPAFDDTAKKQQALALRATEVAQPALAAVSTALLAVLESFGVRLRAAVGHSFGELVALHAAGRLATRDLHRLARARGVAMAAGEGGSMLAVLAPFEDTKGFVDAHHLDLVIANRNAPSQFVLSGADHEIERAEREAKAAKLRVKRLDVAAAFHSPLVASACEPFAHKLERVPLVTGSLPVWANRTGEPYPHDVESARRLLAEQLVHPVEFTRSIEGLYASGLRNFLEIGPGRRLCGLVEDILAGCDVVTASLDESSGRRHGVVDLARALCALSVRGVNVDWARWDESLGERVAPAEGPPKFAIQIGGGNYRDPSGTPVAPARVAVENNASIDFPPEPSALSPEGSTIPSDLGGQEPPTEVKVSSSAPERPPISATEPDVSDSSHRKPKSDVSPDPQASVDQPVDPQAAGSLDPNLLSDALRVTQESLSALLRLQHETASLHRRFLEGQDVAAQHFESLMERQHGMLTSSIGTLRLSNQEFQAERTSVVPPAEAPRAAAASAPDEAADVLASDLIGGDPEPEVVTPEVSPSHVPTPEVSESVAPPASVLPVADVAQAAFPIQEALAPAPAVPEPAPAPASAPAPTAAAVPADLADKVLLIVAEKTGYPVEMLDLSMGLDSDLGIDSIKRVEILAALREQDPTLPEIEADRMGELDSLEAVVQALAAFAPPEAEAPQGSMAPHQAEVPVASAPAPAPTAVPSGPSAADQALADELLLVVAEKTGYPVEMLELSMGLDSDLGIDSIKRVEILAALQERLPELPEVDPEELAQLATLQEIVAAMGGGASAPAAAPPSPAAEPTPAVPAGAQSPAIASPAQASAAVAPSALADELLQVVADKTGYPVEMLELSMGLDSDLGIDSIKRVEILGAMSERHPELQSVDADRLAELETLEEVVAALAGTATQPATATEPQAPPASPQAPVQAAPPVDPLPSLDAPSVHSPPPETGPVAVQPSGEVPIVVASQLQALREPEPHPEPPVAAVDRFALRTESIAEDLVPGLLPSSSLVWVTHSGDGVSNRIVDELCALGLDAQNIDLEQTLSPEAVPQELAGLVLVAPMYRDAGAGDRFLHQAFKLLQTTSSVLRVSGRKRAALVACLTRLDGRFGLGDLEDSTPVVAAGLAGLVKTVHHEWSEVAVRCVDAAPELLRGGLHRVASALLREGPLEIGLDEHEAVTLVLERAPIAGNGGLRFDARDTVLITGGARGVTAEVALALARHGGPRLLLIGRTELVPSEPAWLASLQDEASIKRAVLERAGRRMTPREVEGEYRSIISQREIRHNLLRLRAAGAAVEYIPLDVTDSAAVSITVDHLRHRFGPITGVVHGAGVLADKLINVKSDEDWRRVYDTKVVGLRLLLQALRDQPLRALVLFSSSTGRFGRVGQADYATANEVLNKIAQVEARAREGCRVVSVNWGPWQGGMVTAALEEQFRTEGIETIPLQAGGEYLVQELMTSEREVEVVILGQGSKVPAPPRQVAPARVVPASSQPQVQVIAEPLEPIPSNGLESTGPHAGLAPPLRVAPNGNGANGHVPQVQAPQAWKPVIRRELTLATHPFLRSHVMNGKAVLPAAMMIEWMAHGALHHEPGKRFVGLESFRVLKGLRLDGGEVSLEISTGERQSVNSRDRAPQEIEVPVQLSSPDGKGGARVHARAMIRLADSHPETVGEALRLDLPQVSVSRDRLYDDFLFHGPAFQGLADVEGCSPDGIMATSLSSAPPGRWMENPLRGAWLADPVALDVGFQLMIVWSQHLQGLASLPAYIERYRQFRKGFPREVLRVVAKVQERREHRAVADLEWQTLKGEVVARMTGYECVIDASLNKAFARNSILSYDVSASRHG